MTVKTITLPKTAAAQFRDYHNRATNTLEPQKWPAWLTELDAAIESKEAVVLVLSFDASGGQL